MHANTGPHLLRLDAVVFIRFIRMCRHLFLVLAILGCGGLIPVNVIATIRGNGGVAPADKISMLTMSGIKDILWIWAHTGAIWCFSLIMMAFIYHGYDTFLKFRIQYFESDSYQEDMASRTVMLAGLPGSLQSDEKLMKFMNSLGLADKPIQAMVGRKVEKLPELLEEHKKMVTALEKVLTKYYADPSNPPAQRPTVTIATGLCGSNKVDAVDYYSERIEQITDQIENVRQEVSKSQTTNYAFVSYATIPAAHRVAKLLSNPVIFRTRSKMVDPPELFLSPVPKDVIWFNAANPKSVRNSRRLIVNGLFIIGSLLFFIPMASLTTLAKLDTITGLVPQSADFFNKNPVITGIVQSLLPILFMDVLFLIIRKFIVYLAFLQGNITKSSADRSTLSKFYLFFTINNLLIFGLSATITGFFGNIKSILVETSISSASWDAIKKYVSEQDNIVELLAEQIIKFSLFWVNYISLRNFGALLDLFQIVNLFFHWLKRTVTPREKQALDEAEVFEFPTFFSAHLFLLTVALLYSVIAPLVLFFSAVYFALASLVYKYQLMYVFQTKIETGGRLFRVVFNRLIAALILFQVVMIGVLNLKAAHKQSIAVIPLPIIAILFKIFLRNHFDPRIDFYDYGSDHHRRHSAQLSSSFENPALRAKMITALVPDSAKKLLSNKVLNGGNDHADRGRGRSGSRSGNKNKSRAGSRKGSSSHGRKYAADDDMPQNEMETIEMNHFSKADIPRPAYAKTLETKPSYDSLRGQRHQQNSTPTPAYDEYSSPHILGDDLADSYYDDQKESLTKSVARNYDDTYRTPSPSTQSQSSQSRYQHQQKPSYGSNVRVYGEQDMTSFIAGRYRADKTNDIYSYSSRNNSSANVGHGSVDRGDATNESASIGATPSKPSYREMAKMYQSEGYKTTGKTTQIEERNALQALHLPRPKHNRRQRQDTATQQQSLDDPFQEPALQQQLQQEQVQQQQQQQQQQQSLEDDAYAHYDDLLRTPQPATTTINYEPTPPSGPTPQIAQAVRSTPQARPHSPSMRSESSPALSSVGSPSSYAPSTPSTSPQAYKPMSRAQTQGNLNAYGNNAGTGMQSKLDTRGGEYGQTHASSANTRYQQGATNYNNHNGSYM
ncbi:hypothetical protein BGW38_010178 [Lunasporangiospora selenospora]|uniref:DUF221-domain-containing protein n=1 Tax=Lunasporangiospora selenospora TaxID=979761 RepID=A0A9P6KIJ8_9FUNG|nr:hypothetical protein BGW38_010178 [Lunasporangiospora selenospora]